MKHLTKSKASQNLYKTSRTEIWTACNEIQDTFNAESENHPNKSLWIIQCLHCHTLHTCSTSFLHSSESQLPCLYVIRGGYYSFKNPLKRRLVEAADDNREPSMRSIQVCTQVCGVFQCLSQSTSQVMVSRKESCLSCKAFASLQEERQCSGAFSLTFHTAFGLFSVDRKRNGCNGN